MYEYSVLDDKWQDTETPMSRERYSHSCLLVNEQELIVIGGEGEDLNDDTDSTSEIFNFRERAWRPGPVLPIHFDSGKLLKAKESSEYIGYILGGWGSGAGSGLLIHGLTKDLRNVVKLGSIEIEEARRNSFVALALPETISEKCAN